MLKRLFDIAVSLAAFVLVLPALLLIASIERIRTGRRAIVGVRRVGQGGRIFTMYCFDQLRAPRSMYMSLLAHLPQLMNVLKGDMSIVGPQPLAPEHLHWRNPAVRQVLAVRPGLCSPALLALVVARTGTAAVVIETHSYHTQIAPVQQYLDVQYARTCSFRTDMQVLAQALRLFAQPGRYALLPGPGYGLSQRVSAGYGIPGLRMEEGT